MSMTGEYQFAVWGLVADDQEPVTETRELNVVGTGHPVLSGFNENPAERFLGTMVMTGPYLVVHVFSDRRIEPWRPLNTDQPQIA